MTHLNDAHAADFVRGLVTGEERDPIDRHLGTGCARCHARIAVFRAIARTADSEGRWEPSAAALERALDIFPERPRRVAGLKRQLLPRLLFDSFRQPLAVGVRSSASASRQLLYRAGNYFLDVRLEYERDATRISLIGQIAQRIPHQEDQPYGASAPVSVLLTDGHAVLARAPLNRFGEFHLEYEPRPGLRLRVALDAAQTGVELPLSRLLRPRPEPGSGCSKNETPGRKS